MRKRLRFADLVALGLFSNRVTLANWQRDHGFPLGLLIGNTRSWDEAEIEVWLASQRSPKKQTPRGEVRRNRDRKAVAESTAA